MAISVSKNKSKKAAKISNSMITKANVIQVHTLAMRDESLARRSCPPPLCR